MKKHWPFIVIAAVTMIFFTMRLGRDLLWDWDECLYGQYAVEMTRTGHFITNIWNGYIDLQKPPLYSWILSAVNAASSSEFALRSISVIGALALLASIYFFASKYLTRRIAVLSTLLMLTAEVFVIYSMKLSTDILYSLCIFLAFWLWWISRNDTKGLKIYGAGVLFGLAVMIKGLGSLQFIISIAAATVLFPSKRKWINLLKLSAAFAAVIIPWHAVAYLMYGDRFIKVYILDNIIKRSRYPIEFHRERIWFYFVLLFRELKPWIAAFFIFPAVLLISLFRKSRGKSFVKIILGELKKNELTITILLLFLLPLASITRVQTRIAWYILPLYPFLSVYLAYNLNIVIEYIGSKNKKAGAIFYAILLILLSLDALKLLTDEVKPFNKNRTVDPRYEVMLEAEKQPETELFYLVAFGERQAKELLPPTEQIDMTWVYGGNPCAVYYSKKHVTYYYEIADFEKALRTKKGLFLIQNGDAKYSEGKEVRFRNSDFTLFTK